MRINRFTPERGATQPRQHCGSRGRDASVGCRYDCIGLSERRRDLSRSPPSSQPKRGGVFIARQTY